MATNTLARMRQLVGTAAQWAANDLVIGDGEIAILKDGDLRSIRIGDGIKRFSELAMGFTGNLSVWDKEGIAIEPVGGASVHFRRDTNYAGGTPGYVNSGLRVDTWVKNAASTSFEWGLTSVIYNNASGGENVAGYFQGHKQNTGPTWGAVIEVIEDTPTNNPTTGTVALEVDISVNGTDNGLPGGRVGVDLAIRRQVPGGAAAEAAWGYRIQGDAGAKVGRGYSFFPPMTVDIAFDCAQATVTTAAFRMAQDQVMSFNLAGTRQLTHNGGGWVFKNNTGTSYWSMNDNFSLVANGVQLLGQRQTGWAAPTGTMSRATYDTATVTLPQLAQRLAQLQVDLALHGLIGP